MPHHLASRVAFLLFALLVHPRPCSPTLRKKFEVLRLNGGVQYYEGMRDERGRSKSNPGKLKFMNATMINEECRRWLEAEYAARRHANFERNRQECTPRSKSAPHEMQFSASSCPIPTGSDFNTNLSLFQSRIWSTGQPAISGQQLNWSEVTSKSTVRSSSSEEWLNHRLRGGKPESKSSVRKNERTFVHNMGSPLGATSPGEEGGAAAQVEAALKMLETCDSSRSDMTSREGIAQLQALSEQGNGRAAFNLAQIYERGNYGMTADASKSLELLQNSALHGYPPAMYHIGIRCLSGKGVARNETMAIGWWRKASRLGHEKSQMRLGVYLLDRGQRTTDPQGAAMVKEAVALLNTASSQGLPDAKYVLGAYLLAVSKGSSERKEALALIQAAADVGHVLSSAVMGRILLKGDPSIKSDEIKAAKYIEKAALGGDADSQYLYGCLFMDGFRREVEESTSTGSKQHDSSPVGKLVEERDPIVAFEWFKKAAESGSAEAQYKVAMRQLQKFRDSDFQRTEKAEALDLLKKAAQAGHMEAAWQMAHQLMSLARTLRVKVSRKIVAEAGQWLEEAAHGGHAKAQLLLGQSMRDGRFGFAESTNRSIATEWLKRAAEAGELEAQVEYALALVRGDGVKQDESSAREWLSLAAAAGNMRARYELAKHLLANVGERNSLYEDIANPSKKAVDLLRDCVQHGYLDAMYELCRLFRAGNWMIKSNRTEAIHLYRSLLEKREDPEIAMEFATLLLENKYRDIQSHGRERAFVDEVREGLKWLRFAFSNDVEGAEKSLRDAQLQFSRFLNMQEMAGELGAGLEHLNISYPAHLGTGRLRITLVRPRNLPKCAAGQGKVPSKPKQTHVYVTLESERHATAADSEEEEEGVQEVDNFEKSWDGELGVRWTKVYHSSRFRHLKLTGGHGMREAPISTLEVQTRKVGRTSKVWNDTFACYLNGSKNAFHRPMVGTLHVEVEGRREFVSELGSFRFYPWQIPFRRKYVTWLPVLDEHGAPVKDASGATTEVLLEISRSRAGPPGMLKETEEQKELSKMFITVPSSQSHIELALRREEAKFRKEFNAKVLISTDQVVVDHEGTTLPWSILQKVPNLNRIYEPIVAKHRDTKFLNEFQGDFDTILDFDPWTERCKNGDWKVPGRNREFYDWHGPWYEWLRKYTKGLLTRKDVPAGSLPPYMKKTEIRRQIRKLAWEKVKTIHVAREKRRLKKKLQQAQSKDTKTSSGRPRREGRRGDLSSSMEEYSQEETQPRVVRPQPSDPTSEPPKMSKLCSKSSFLQSLLRAN